MLGQCAKYALELENKQEKVVWVDTKQPEVTAMQHLKKLQVRNIFSVLSSSTLNISFIIIQNPNKYQPVNTGHTSITLP